MSYTTFASRRLIAAAILLTMGCQNLDQYGTSMILDAPSGLRAVPGGANTIALEWERPTSPEGKMTYRLFRDGVEVGVTEATGYGDTGLLASTTYSYAVSAVDRFGNMSPSSNAASATTMGAGMTDNTAPSVPLNLTAAPASSSSIALGWTPSTDASGVLGYRVFREGIQIGVTGTAGFTDSGLAPSTEYTYTIAAYDGAGNVSAASDPASATTLAAGETDTGIPSVPQLLTAVPASATSIGLGWEASTDDHGVLGYQVYRNGTPVGTAAGTGYTDTGLTANTMYSYTVAAFDAAGNMSAPSASASVTTLGSGASDTEAPTVPASVVAFASSSSDVTVSWDASTDNVGVLGYRVFRGGVQIGTAAGTSYEDSGLSASTTYTYTVAAYDAASNVSAQSAGADAVTLGVGVTDTEAPSAPTGLGAIAASSSSVALSWTPSTDNVGVVGYDVYRDGNLIGTTVTTAYTDNAVCAATGFIYTVTARDAAGNVSDPSAPAGVTTLNVAVDLGTAGNFSVLAGSGVDLLGGLLPSVIVSGDVGTSPSNSILGSLLLNLLSGVLHAGDGVAATAQADLGAAFGDLIAQPACSGDDLTGQNLGGLTLDAGVHAFSSNASLNGTLTLDAEGDPNAVFVIKVPGTLNVANAANVTLTGGAQPENVYWVVGGSANVGTLATMRGNILAGSSVNLGLTSVVDGRVLARTGTVSLLVNTIGL